jgi:hypothetical protein
MGYNAHDGHEGENDQESVGVIDAEKADHWLNQDQDSEIQGQFSRFVGHRLQKVLTLYHEWEHQTAEVR